MIRNAKMADIQAIYQLLKCYSDQDLLLGRSLSSLYDQLRDFKVYAAESDTVVAGCGQDQLLGVGALHVCWENLAEIRSVAVAECCQGRGIGRELVVNCLQEAELLGIGKVFTLTYQPEFFKKFGFLPVDKNELPHKVWSDCIQCPKFPDCNEEALIWERK